MLPFLASTLSVHYPDVGRNPLAPGCGNGDFSGDSKCVYTYITGDDAHPIVSTANCTIQTSDLDTGCVTTETTRVYARTLGSHDGVDDDDAGHILAHRLGGNGKEPTNIFPQAPGDNRGPWREFEADIYDCIQGGGGGSAVIGWSFDYKSRTNTRPSQVRVSSTHKL